MPWVSARKIRMDLPSPRAASGSRLAPNRMMINTAMVSRCGQPNPLSTVVLPFYAVPDGTRTSRRRSISWQILFQIGHRHAERRTPRPQHPGPVGEVVVQPSTHHAELTQRHTNPQAKRANDDHAHRENPDQGRYERHPHTVAGSGGRRVLSS